MRRAITPTEQQGPSGNKAFRLNLGLSAAVCALILGLWVSSLFTVEASEKEHRLTVRLLDPRNGKPLTGVSLGILVWKQGRTIDLGNAVTDAHGVATFHLPDVIPERIGINHSPVELRWCCDQAFPTDTILKTGMVAQCRCDEVNFKCDQFKLKTTPSAAAGELVVFARRVTFWEHFVSELP